jgi:hypothetical protein
MNEEEEDLITHVGPAGTHFSSKHLYPLSLSSTTICFATERYFFFGLTFFFYLVSALYKDGEHVDGYGWALCRTERIDTMYTQ